MPEMARTKTVKIYRQNGAGREYKKTGDIIRIAGSNFVASADFPGFQYKRVFPSSGDSSVKEFPSLGTRC
jgi:hypothetical protein